MIFDGVEAADSGKTHYTVTATVKLGKKSVVRAPASQNLNTGGFGGYDNGGMSGANSSYGRSW